MGEGLSSDLQQMGSGGKEEKKSIYGVSRTNIQQHNLVSTELSVSPGTKNSDYWMDFEALKESAL